MKTTTVHLPEISTYCPECDAENYVNGDEFERAHHETLAVASTVCEECDESYFIRLVN